MSLSSQSSLIVGTGEAARMLKVCRRRVTTLVSKGKLKALPLPGRKHIRILVDELHHFATETGRTISPATPKKTEPVETLLRKAETAGDTETAYAIRKAVNDAKMHIPVSSTASTNTGSRPRRIRRIDEIDFNHLSNLVSDLQVYVAEVGPKMDKITQAHGDKSDASRAALKALVNLQEKLDNWHATYQERADRQMATTHR